MNDVKTSRPFQERLLDGYNRSQLRQEVQKVKPQQSGSLRKKYATMALGVSLALGGHAVPLNLYQSIDANGRRGPSSTASGKDPQLARDLQTAEEIAVQLKRRVDMGVASVSDQLRADFFLKQVPFGSIIYSEA